MNKQILIDTIHQLFEGNKGLPAMDESNGTWNKRFAAAAINVNGPIKWDDNKSYS